MVSLGFGGKAEASHVKGYDLSHSVAATGTVTFVYRSFQVNSLKYPAAASPGTGIRFLHFGDGDYQGTDAIEVLGGPPNCQIDSDGKCRIEYSDCEPPGNDATTCDTATTTRIFTHDYLCPGPVQGYVAFITRGTSPTIYECCRADGYNNIPSAELTSIRPRNVVFPCCDNTHGDPNSGPSLTSSPVYNGFQDSAYVYPLGASDRDGDPLWFAFLTETPVAPFQCPGICTASTPGLLTLAAYDACQSPRGAVMGFNFQNQLDWDLPKTGLDCDLTRPGFYGVAARVTDTCGSTAEREFRLELFPPSTTSAPDLSVSPQPQPGLLDVCIDRDIVNIDLTGSDADTADVVSLFASPLPYANAALSAATGNPAIGNFTFEPKSADGQLGTHGFTFTAQDDGAPIRTTQRSIAITVIDCNANRPPTADSGGDYAKECNGQPTQAALDGTRSSDPEADPLTYKWYTTCPYATFDDDTSATPILSLPGNPPCPSVCTVTLRVVDSHGGSSFDTDFLTVDDTTPPDAAGLPADATAECDAVPAPAAVTAVDDCDPMPSLSFTETRIDGSCTDNYDLERFWTTGDACGNKGVFTQTVAVSDSVAPRLIGLPVEVTVGCASEIPEVPAVTSGDNCDPSVSPAFTETTIDVVCPNRFTVVREWSAVDRCSNRASETRMVFVNDVTPPSLVGVPVDGTASCDAIPVPAQVSAVDGCDGGVSVTLSEQQTDVTCAHGYTLVRTWTAIDACGNAASASQRIQVSDTAAPQLQNVPVDVTVECDAIPTAPTLTALDNCDAAPVVTLVETREDVICEYGYTLVRTWTARDACGNSSEAIQRIRVVDTTAPVLVGVPADETVECGQVPQEPIVTATDNCSEGLIATMTETRVNGTCADAYVLRREWRAVDTCGNVAVATQVITVSDTTRPVIPSVPPETSAECNAVPSPPVITATDNCDPSPVVSLSETITPRACPDSYDLVRTWTARDRCGNERSESQPIRVDDTTRPVVRAMLMPLAPTLPCSAPAERRFQVVCDASDNCSPPPPVQAKLRVRQHDVTPAGCEERLVDVPVLCGEVVELHLISPPCPLKPPSGPQPTVIIDGTGTKVVTGENITLEVQAADRCGNVGVASWDPVSSPGGCGDLTPPPDANCKVPVCGRCAPTVSPLARLTVSTRGEGCGKDAATAAALRAAAAGCVGPADPQCVGDCRLPQWESCGAAAWPARARVTCLRTALASCPAGDGFACTVVGTIDCGCGCD